MALKYIDEGFGDYGIIEEQEKEILDAAREYCEENNMLYLREHEIMMLCMIRMHKRIYERRRNIVIWAAAVCLGLIIFIFAYHKG